MTPRPRSRAPAALAGLLLLLGGALVAAQTGPRPVGEDLKVVDYNIWHGLNPTSNLRFASFDAPGGREERLQAFLEQARDADADVLVLQEVNPAPGLTRRMADALGYDGVWTLDNAGLKLGSLGVPTNLRSGLCILAKKELGLKKLGARKLSGPRGFVGEALSVQTSEFRYVLAATIRFRDREILLLNTHLHHGPELTPETKHALAQLVEEGAITAERSAQIAAKIDGASTRRRSEIESALALVADLGAENMPVLFAGDFNASPDAPELDWLRRVQGFSSVTRDRGSSDPFYTWDWERNPNTHTIATFQGPNEFGEPVDERLAKLEIGLSRRLDYIFHRGMNDYLTVIESGLFGDRPAHGRMASDHFGVFAVFQKP